MRKRKMAYPPTVLLRQVSDRCPYAWEEMDYYNRYNGLFETPAWDRRCYVPVLAAMSMLTISVKQCPENEKVLKEKALLSYQIAALAPWRKNKVVVTMDRKTERFLLDRPGKLEIHSEALMCLPYQSYYIETNHLNLLGETFHGLFVHLDHEPVNNEKRLRLLFLRSDSRPVGYSLKAMAGSVEDSIKETVNETYCAMVGDNPIEYMCDTWREMDLHKQLSCFLRNAMIIVLYTFAKNAVILPVVEHLMKAKYYATSIREENLICWNAGFGVSIVHQMDTYDRYAKEQPAFRLSDNARLQKRTGNPLRFGDCLMKSLSSKYIEWLPPHFVSCADIDLPIDAEFEPVRSDSSVL